MYLLSIEFGPCSHEVVVQRFTFSTTQCIAKLNIVCPCVLLLLVGFNGCTAVYKEYYVEYTS